MHVEAGRCRVNSAMPSISVTTGLRMTAPRNATRGCITSRTVTKGVAMSDGFLTVKVAVPLDEYRLLNAGAEEHKRTVAEIIAARITTPRHGGRREGAGRPSAYTPELGSRIAAGRALNMSWPEISRKLGIATTTARDWFKKYETEK